MAIKTNLELYTVEADFNFNVDIIQKHFVTFQSLNKHLDGLI
jgi:hypothetical protein